MTFLKAPMTKALVFSQLGEFTFPKTVFYSVSKLARLGLPDQGIICDIGC